jgi:hypothetical protein
MSSSPGTVRWTSQNRSWPSHGKWGLPTSMPPPSAERSDPIAHPFEAVTGSTAANVGAAVSSVPSSPSPPPGASGGSAVEMKFTSAVLEACRVIDRAYA